MFVQIQALLGFVRFLPMYCLHNHLFLKFFYLEFSGLFYCSVINVHFASKTLYSLASSAVLMTYFVCVSEIYIITLALTCQALFLIFLFFCFEEYFSDSFKTIFTIYCCLLISLATTNDILSPICHFVNNFVEKNLKK